MPRANSSESDLYEPVKRMLEAQGYVVKSEIGAADVVAVRGEEPPVIIELKTSFALTLFHQAIERQAITDFVYIATGHKTGKPFQKALKRNKSLCRRLGLGLIIINDDLAQIHLDPGPYQPRKSKARTGRLLKEFYDRVGDPNEGGQTRKGLMTTYRQNALKCVIVLAGGEPEKAAIVRDISGVKTARNIMADDHYGWFERAARGVYRLTPKGKAALTDYAADIKLLKG